jgi:hypothetical protein
MTIVYRFGFVTFPDEVTAGLALNSSPQKRILDGRVVAFSKAKPKKESLVVVATGRA